MMLGISRMAVGAMLVVLSSAVQAAAPLSVAPPAWNLDYLLKTLPPPLLKISTETKPAKATVVFVDKNNISGTEDGLSWATAYNTVQEGIDGAFSVGGGEVWVADGVYDEARTSTIENVNTGSVIMKSGVQLYGGFAGAESAREQRDWQAHVTTLDGSKSREGLPAYHVVVGANNATLDGFTITGGSAEGEFPNYHGGGMLNDSVSPTVANCVFSGNYGYYGGGLDNISASPTVTNCTFAENTANYGGGMSNTSSSSPTVTDCTFSGNNADDGGGMFINGESTPTVTNCTFSGNSAATYGGGISNESSTPTVTNCTFTNNSTQNYGGGMANYTAVGSVTGCTFTGNSAGSGYGGGMYNVSSSPAVTNCAFSENSAGPGGGMYSEGFSSPTVTNCTFSGNSATSGGGMANYASSPAVTNCTFSGNSATGGGGMHNEESSSPTVTNCTFSGNSATEGGGGMANISSSPTITNCILWNDVPIEISNVEGSGPSVPIVTFSNIQLPAKTVYDGQGNINQDPLFIPGVTGDFRLLGGSPCIDSGTASGAPTEDILGLSRPQGAGVDMGAYENPTLDSDGDRIPDAWEGSGDPDGDETPNYLDTDSDGDGLTDTEEALNLWNPYDADMDGDGMLDGWEVANNLDPVVEDADGDPDADSLTNGGEFAAQTDPNDSDSDDDQMPDGWEVEHDLNPLLAADASSDPDGDQITNLQELGIQTDPQNALDPPDDVYVSIDPLGNDETGDGSSNNAWRHIQYAIDTASRYATDFHAVTIHIGQGEYTEKILLEPHIRLQGESADNPELTLIQFFSSEDPAGPSQYVVVTAAEDTELQDLEISFPPGTITQNVVLLRIDNVVMRATNIILNGDFVQNSTAATVASPGSSASVIQDSIIEKVKDGVYARSSGINVRRCRFRSMTNDAIFVALPDDPKAVGETPLLGRAGEVETAGLNQFDLSVEGKFIRSANPNLTMAENNDWGVYTPEAIEAKLIVVGKTGIEQSFDYTPFIGSGILPGMLAVDLRDSEAETQIPGTATPGVSIDSLHLDGERDDESGLFLLGPLPPGSYTVSASASSYTPGDFSTQVGNGIAPLELLLTPDETALPEDIDGVDGVTAVDVQLVINAALGVVGQYDCDVDGDNDEDAVDIQLVINAALGVR